MPQAGFSYNSIDELIGDFGMTLQVALIGDDEIVIGSDRLLAKRGLHGALGYGTQEGKKIYISSDRSVVCAFSGGPNSEVIARRIATNCNPLELSDMDWRNSVETAATESVTEYSEHIIDEVFVARCADHSVLKLIRQRNETVNFMPISSHECSGIESSARAIPKLFWRDDLSLDELENLAVLTIGYGCQEFPNLVGFGIDVVRIDSDGQVREESYTLAQSANIRSAFVEQIYRSLKNPFQKNASTNCGEDR